MKLLQGLWMPSLSTIAMCIALGVGAGAMAAEPPRQPGSADQAKPKASVVSEQPKATANAQAAKAKSEKAAKPTAEPLKLKVFRLKYDDPQSVGLAVQLLLSPPGTKKDGMVGGLGGLGAMLPGGVSQGALLGGIGGLAGIGGIGGGVIGGIGGIGGGPGINGAQLGGVGALGGGIGGFAGAPAFGMAGGPAPPPSVQGAIAGATRLAADTSSGALLARGPERDLKVIADVVTVLNTAPGKPLSKVKNVHAFRLKYANPEDVGTAVALLGIEARLAPLRMPDGDAGSEDQRRFLFALGTEEQIRDIAEVIEGMDVEPKENAGAAP